jgi:hypothetical protein
MFRESLHNSLTDLHNLHILLSGVVAHRAMRE